ncbi:hypothetical protein GO755_12300 [Spirosoma sp. HMF4905]|uniref:Copper-binding protein MbnP-like domain-containing protein n=1 Tax=Spirosoma arboris TaxID=2682092 RepID=A0A7K1SAG3_9BACT|nr:MbnP family protein [Spirosoma arboris]MVM30814.1 hypothetical protein [Spirosoma arboris]
MLTIRVDLTMSYRYSILFIASLIVVVWLSACQKNESVTPTPVGTVYLHLHTNLDSSEVDDYGTIYQDGNGHRIYLTLAQLYVSGVKAIKADGSTVSLDSAIILKTKEFEQFRVQQLPAGEYSSVSFLVGLNATTNQANPASYPATSALSAQQPSMWFGSTNQGYMFVNVQGGVDTTKAQNAPLAQFQPFCYQLGTADELKTITMPTEKFTISPGQGQEVHITIDYAKLLQGLNLKTENKATPFSNLTVANKVTNNIPAMFRYEE